MAVKIDKGRALETLSLAPLIDVVFLLLVFFLVATRFAQEENELDVLLPSASKAQPMVIEPQELTINIQNSGAYFVGGKTVNQQELLLLLTSSVLNNPSQTVVIRADQRVEFVFVATAMDLCNQAGIFDYTVATSGEM